MDLKSFYEDKLKLTRKEFADQLHVAETLIVEWENNTNIGLSELELISGATGISFNEICGWKKPIPKPIEVDASWEQVDFTKQSLANHIKSALDKKDILDEQKEKYIDGLRRIVDRSIIKPKVAIVGRSDTGKSTLINALLGAEKMPASWTPTTSIAVYIKHISDRPSYIKDEVWVFRNHVGKEECWDERRLSDEKYCRSWRIGKGGVDILRSYGTHQGENYGEAAGAAVVFLDSSVLKSCDIIDLPGFGTETESDDNITFSVAQRADAIIYLSIANGFMRIEDITYLKRNISELPIFERRGENDLAPLTNLFVVASQASGVNYGNRKDLENILNVGCKNLIKTLPAEYWRTRKTASGYEYADNGATELRSRFFAYDTDIPDICEPFNTSLKQLLNSLPDIINKVTKQRVRKYIKMNKPNLISELQKYEDIVLGQEKYKKLLAEIEDNEVPRIADNDKRKAKILTEIDQLCDESMVEFSQYTSKTIDIDFIKGQLKEKKVRNKKEEIELFASALQSEVQTHCEAILERKSQVLSRTTSEYVAEFSKSVSTSFENNSVHVDFDAGWVFASALSTLSIVGGIGAFAVSTISGAILFSGLGYTAGAAAYAGMITASIAGPIGIAAGLAVVAGMRLVKLFGGGWEKSVAKKIVNTFEEEKITEKYREAIKKYWAQSRETFENASAELEQNWKSYVTNLRNMINEKDIDEIERKIAGLKNISLFFDSIQL